MFLGMSGFGLDVYFYTSPRPVSRAYSRIIIAGVGIVDKVNIKSKKLSNLDLTLIDYRKTLQQDNDTLLLAEFNNDLDGGNIIGLTTPLTEWGVFRQEEDSTTLVNLGTTDPTVLEFTDYLAQANKTYTYYVFPITATQVGQALQTEEILADFYGVYLIDEDTKTVFFFDLDIATNTITNQTDVTEFENYTKYNAFSFGDRDFIKGTIQATAGEFDALGILNYDETYFENLKSIINNKKNKVLKFRNGKMIRVITSNFEYSLMDNIQEQPYSIKFDFVEVGDI